MLPTSLSQYQTALVKKRQWGAGISGSEKIVASIQDPATLEETNHHDHEHDQQKQVNQVAGEGNDKRTHQPEDEQDDNDRFERVARHGRHSQWNPRRPKMGDQTSANLAPKRVNRWAFIEWHENCEDSRQRIASLP